MKISVKKDACIGCGTCAAISEELFEINDEGLAEAKVEEVPEDKFESAKEASESCPTNAIEVKE